MLKRYGPGPASLTVEPGRTVTQTVKDLGLDPDLVAIVMVNGRQEIKSYRMQDGDRVKLVVRRGRPGPSDGLYDLVPWTGSLSTGALSFPSTNAIVAFAGAFAMAHLSPRSATVWLALGAGCALTRLLDGKHFLSDVVAAAALAAGLVAILAEAMAPDRLDPA